MSDADQIRTVANRVAALARDLRGYATRTGTGQGVDWHSAGAQQYRKRLSDTAAALGGLARDMDSLAGALRRYATAVESRESAVGNVIDDVIGGVGGAITRTAENLGHVGGIGAR